MAKWDHLIEGVYSGKPLLFPTAKSFDDLFSDAKVSRHKGTPPRGWAKPWAQDDGNLVTGERSLELYTIGPHCSIRSKAGYGGLWVNARPHVVNAIKNNMIEAGSVSFQIIQRTPGDEALIVAQYEQISGSRWLAIVPWTTVPLQK